MEPPSWCRPSSHDTMSAKRPSVAVSSNNLRATQRPAEQQRKSADTLLEGVRASHDKVSRLTTTVNCGSTTRASFTKLYLHDTSIGRARLDARRGECAPSRQPGEQAAQRQREPRVDEQRAAGRG